MATGSTENEKDDSLLAAVNASSDYSLAASNAPGNDSEDDDDSASFTTASSSRTQLADDEDMDYDGDDYSDFGGDLWEQIDKTTLMLILIPMIAKIIGRKCTSLTLLAVHVVLLCQHYIYRHPQSPRKGPQVAEVDICVELPPVGFSRILYNPFMPPEKTGRSVLISKRPRESI